MKHLNYFLCSMIFFSFFIVSCEKDEPVPEPVASFTMSKSSAEINETITFTNSSENTNSYLWDFGDGNTSTNENPTHTYSSIGTYTVSLIATGDGGENSTSKTITVAYPFPIANFTMDKSSAEINETITFTNSSENVTSYFWDFGDGNTSTDENPTHSYSYSQNGERIISLTAINSSSEHTYTKTIKINETDLIGKWNLIEGEFENNSISNLTGYFEFITDTTYYAKIIKSSYYVKISTSYSISEDKMSCRKLFDPVYLLPLKITAYNGDYISSYISEDAYTQFGATAVGQDANYIKINIEDKYLILESSNGKTKLKYTKD